MVILCESNGTIDTVEPPAEASTGTDQAAFVIAGWTVDPVTLRISKDEETIKLEPKAMAVLVYLAARQGWGPITLLALSHPGLYWLGDIKEIKDGLRAIGKAAGYPVERPE